ncbi:MAG: acetoacetate--CoA ligase, partial [Promethearchaeota archaeon]
MKDNRKKLWEPSADWIKNANITRFIEFVNREYGQNIKGGKDLYKFSVEKIEDFWDAMWKFSDIIASKP